MATDWLAAVLPANQKPYVKILEVTNVKAENTKVPHA